MQNELQIIFLALYSIFDTSIYMSFLENSVEF